MQARISRLKSIGPPEDPAPPKTASVSAGRRWIWRGVTFGFLIIGLTGSCLAAAGWTSSQRTRNAREFTGRAANIASAVGESIQRAVDLQRSFGQLVATTPDPTNATLVPWLTSLDIPNTYPGSTGMTVVEPVPASALPAYQQSVAVDPVAGYGRGPYAVYPPGERPRYCLSRFGLIMQATAEPAGIDLCAPDIFGVANILPGVLDRATESNLPQFVGFASIMDPLKRVLPPSVYRTYRQQFLVTVPVYAGGSPPPLSVPRQSALVGWVVSDFEGDTMMDAAVPNAGGTFIRLTVDGQTMASLGPTARPSWQSRTMPLPIGLGLSLTVAQARTTAPTTQGVVLGSLGALLTFLLFVIGYGFGRSRERALRLVDERTEDLRFQALHDTLTGLPNRALLFDRAEQILARARRQPKAVGALYLDIDNFKDVNDSLGHSAGDELLKAVADRLQETVRESDTVGRLGGDEFLILTEDDATDAGPEMVAERVLAVLQEPFLLPGEDPVTLRIGASIGVAAGVRATAEELIRDADVALYQAKESGKARTATFRPEMQLAIHNRLSLEMDLGQALERHELFLEYQPIFDLARMSTT
ncbi:MAG TPA: diguanylate cyclase, partial [Acidimicrobiales bacterium]|nr:diguanylate cyclase [Acidimicrobiales bacterium]